jgi:sugar lactone lactonase YvrE
MLVQKRVCAWIGALLGSAALGAAADPVALDPSVASVELVTPAPAEQAKLGLVDDLLFDARGNLLATLEIAGANGGVVWIDPATGVVTPLVTGISRADQIAQAPSGEFYVTSEVAPAATTNRIYRVDVTYDASNRPLSATATSLTTALAIASPEGIAVLPSASAYGAAGDLYVAPDAFGASIVHVSLGTAVPVGPLLARPEGLTVGSYAGAADALYAAETGANRVLRLDANGTVTTIGNPLAVALTEPDNVQLGPDGLIYVSEDRIAPNGRVLRIQADGSHRALLTNCSSPQGLIFDPATGDLLVAEQDLSRVWRVRFATAVPALPLCAIGVGATAIAIAARLPARRALQIDSAS